MGDFCADEPEVYVAGASRAICRRTPSSATRRKRRRRPEIFVMDEATSSVDAVTEALIQRGMEALMRGRTSFVIAHRLSTVKRADRILVIEDGKIAEAGSHAELLHVRGRYYRLYTQQFRREREAEYGVVNAKELVAA